MSRDSLANTKTELAGIIAPGGTPPAGVTAFYSFEPYPGQASRPVWVTLSTAGMQPTEYVIAVRVYVATDTNSADQAAATLDTLIESIDQLIGSTGRFGPSNWETEHDQELVAYVATNLLVVGREDEWSR